MGEARGVAVNSRVGSGVSVGGTGVKVETRVGGSTATSLPMGWKGVEVGDAFGFAVTNTSEGCAASAEGKEQAVSKKNRDIKRKTERVMGCSEAFIG